MAVARATVIRDERAELDEIEQWYRHELAQPMTWPSLRYKPVRIGPTWQTEMVAGREHWVLPERSLGWTMLAWCGRWLQVTRGEPWRFTPEQARFNLWWYALDESGRWLYRDGVLQRLKGWGKDPLGATVCLFELLGDCRFYDWDGDRPIGQDHPDAWVQTAAVSLEQTKNTMRLLPGMLTAEARERYQIQLGKEQVYALGGTRFMQAVTSSPATLEGARATFVLMNETHHWLANNSGHDMTDVIERNATKSAGATARTLRITNAYEPGEDSVAERDREAYEAALGHRRTKAGSTRLLYDSLEAPPEAPLTPEAAPEVTLGTRGDSVWLDVDGIVDSILDIRNPPSRSRRFWFNQITAAEDAWMSPQEWDAIAAPDAVVDPGEPIVAFFDGSKSDDATALVGCRVSDGLVFLIDSWTPDPRDPARVIVPRGEVDRAVADMFDSFAVKAFFGDPSDVRDEEGERFWEPLLDDWHGRYARQLELWAVRSGERTHAISWDMRSAERQAAFTDAAMRFVTEVQDARFAHDGNQLLRRHVLNARRRPNKWGVTLGKEHRESARKVDAAVCAVGARMLRRLYLNKEPTQTTRTGRAWGVPGPANAVAGKQRSGRVW